MLCELHAPSAAQSCSLDKNNNVHHEASPSGVAREKRKAEQLFPPLFSTVSVDGASQPRGRRLAVQHQTRPFMRSLSEQLWLRTLKFRREVNYQNSIQVFCYLTPALNLVRGKCPK